MLFVSNSGFLFDYLYGLPDDPMVALAGTCLSASGSSLESTVENWTAGSSSASCEAWFSCWPGRSPSWFSCPTSAGEKLKFCVTEGLIPSGGTILFAVGLSLDLYLLREAGALCTAFSLFPLLRNASGPFLVALPPPYMQ